MSWEDDTIQTLRESGHRLTPQRMLILSALRHANGHMTTSEGLEHVRESYSYIDASTVYRTLGMLKNLRLIAETNIGTGESFYQWLAQNRHHHLICRECGKLTRLDHKCLASLGTEILEEYGFKAYIDHFAVHGMCEGCAAKESPSLQQAQDRLSILALAGAGDSGPRPLEGDRLEEGAPHGH